MKILLDNSKTKDKILFCKICDSQLLVSGSDIQTYYRRDDWGDVESTSQSFQCPCCECKNYIEYKDWPKGYKEGEHI